MERNSGYFNYLRYTKNTVWSKYLFKKGIPINDFFYKKEDDTVYIRSVNHFFSRGEFPVFFDAYRLYCWKFLEHGFQFVFSNSNMYLKIKDLTFKVDTLQELYII